MLTINFYRNGKKIATAQDDFIPPVGDFTVIESVGYVVVSRRWILKRSDKKWSHVNINVEEVK